MSKVSVEDALPHIVDLFCDSYISQRKMASRTKKVVKLNYEVLISQKKRSLKRIVESLYGSCDDNALINAIERSTINKLKQFETEQGYATHSPQTFTAKHFVRSGKIGEGEDFFSNMQIRLINKILNNAGVPTDGSFDF